MFVCVWCVCVGVCVVCVVCVVCGVWCVWCVCVGVCGGCVCVWGGCMWLVEGAGAAVGVVCGLGVDECVLGYRWTGLVE